MFSLVSHPHPDPQAPQVSKLGVNSVLIPTLGCDGLIVLETRLGFSWGTSIPAGTHASVCAGPLLCIRFQKASSPSLACLASGGLTGGVILRVALCFVAFL